MRVLYTAKNLCLTYSCNDTRLPRHSQHQASTQGAPAAGPHRSQGQKSKDGAETEIQRHLQMFRKQAPCGARWGVGPLKTIKVKITCRGLRIKCR